MADKMECKETVMIGYHTRRCSRKATDEGYCHQHSPAGVAKRDRKSTETYERNRARSPWHRIDKLKEELKVCHEIIKYGANRPEEVECLKTLMLERYKETEL